MHKFKVDDYVKVNKKNDHYNKKIGKVVMVMKGGNAYQLIFKDDDLYYRYEEDELVASRHRY